MSILGVTKKLCRASKNLEKNDKKDALLDYQKDRL